MEKLDWNKVIFIKTAMEFEQCPNLKNSQGHFLPEIAVLGRSNVGKSSLLNDLFGQKLVYTSSRPGKTQGLNFFCVDEKLMLVDLPGFGYAKAPKSMRAHWGDLVQEYLSKRGPLSTLLLLIDARRGMEEEERELIDWLRNQKKTGIVIQTKVDKLTQGEWMKQSAVLQNALQNTEWPCLAYSTKTKLGRGELARYIAGQVRG
jgi:GTP-binding protein